MSPEYKFDQNYVILIFRRIVDLESTTKIAFMAFSFVGNRRWENQLQISPRRFPKFLQSTFRPSKALSAPAVWMLWMRLKQTEADFLLKSWQPDISQLGERPDNENLSATLISSSANSLAVKSNCIRTSLNTWGRRLTPTDMTVYKSE